MKYTIFSVSRFLAAFLTMVFCQSQLAQAEVFTCKQADGTMVFSHVPCREERKQEVQPESDVKLIDYESVALPPRDYAADISALETKLDELRNAREQEIADAPYSTSNPELLYDLKAQIRASYQAKIDANLTELVNLRAEHNRSR